MQSAPTSRDQSSEACGARATANWKSDGKEELTVCREDLRTGFSEVAVQKATARARD